MSNLSFQEHANDMLKKFLNSDDYFEFLSYVHPIIKNNYEMIITENDLEEELKNVIFYWLQNENLFFNNSFYKKISNNKNKMFRAIQIEWDQKIVNSLTHVFEDFDSTYMKPRSTAEREQFRTKWNELSTLSINLDNIRPVYSHRDFIEIVFSVVKTSDSKCDRDLQLSNSVLKTKTLDELKTMYIEISNGKLFLGANYHSNFRANMSQLESDRLSVGENLLKSKNKSTIQDYLKKGSPRSLRAAIWSLLLGSESKVGYIDYYNDLTNKVILEQSILDKLIFKDVQLNASNDDQYFVFEDILYQIMLCFFRDNYNYFNVSKEWLNKLQITRHKNLCIIPFHGFTLYMVPFCYLFKDQVVLYFTFREFYLKYVCPLTIITDHPNSIVGLCVLFERLLRYVDPKLWKYLLQNNVHPLRLAFKWIFRIFSGYLPPDQLLLLWDLIIAYDSLEIVPQLAVAILHLRRKNLFQVHNHHNFQLILSDLSTISVYTLLQTLLSNS